MTVINENSQTPYAVLSDNVKDHSILEMPKCNNELNKPFYDSYQIDQTNEANTINTHSTLNVATQGTFGTLQNLVRPYVGGGLLALPAAFRKGGILSSSILMILMALTANWCVRCLLISAEIVTAPGWMPFDRHSKIQSEFNEKQLNINRRMNGKEPTSRKDLRNGDIHLEPLNNSKTVEESDETATELSFKVPSQPSMTEVGFLAFGSWGSFATDFNLLASQIGFCIAYVCFVGENLSIVFPQTGKVQIIIVFCALLCLLVQIRQVSKLSITSSIGNFVYLFTIGVIFYDGFSNPLFPPKSSSISWVNWIGIPSVFSTACFSLEGIGLMLPVKAEMKEPAKFNKVMDLALTIVTCIYVVFADLGYLFYGDTTKSVITKNLSAGFVSNAVRISLSIILFFTYVVQMFPVVLFTDARIEKRFHKRIVADKQMSIQERMEREIEQGQDRKKIKLSLIIFQSIGRCCCVLLTCIIAIALPDFGKVVDLVGSLCNSAIAFILPTLFYVKLVLWPQHWASRQYPHSSEFQLSHIIPFILPIIVIFVGCTASGIGVYTAIMNIVQPASE